MAAIERDLPGGPPRYSLWSTEQVAPHERFTYYREAICKAFMDLTPELSPTTSFEAKVESIRFGTAALNRVRFPGHTIHRHATDIAASKRSCYYLNLKLRGRCQIHQAGRNLILAAGQVGIFESERLFSIEHDPSPSLDVASFWVPRDALERRLPASFDFRATRLSDHPVVGNLIAETARTFNDQAFGLSEQHGCQLIDILLDLVAFALGHPDQSPPHQTIADAHLVALQREILKRLRKPNLSVATVAAAVRISDRYVHKLFERKGTTFSRYVMDQRLDGCALDLRDPGKSAEPIGHIAFGWGFADLSHFARAFRSRFGCSPTGWRNRH